MIEPNEELVTRVVASVLRELGYGGPPARAVEPEWTPDPVIYREMLRIGKTKFNEISRRPDFPESIKIGRTRYRRTAEIRAWIAAQVA